MTTDPTGVQIGAVAQWRSWRGSHTARLVALQIAAVALAYYLAAEVGLRLAVVREQVTPFWPATGIALAALLTWGLRTWPGIAIGAFLVNLPIGPSPLLVAVIAAGNTTGPVLAYLLLEWAGFRRQLDRLGDALRLLFVGVLGSAAISASVGTLVLVSSAAVPVTAFWATWSVWWTGDAMGLLLVTPLLLTYLTGRWRPLPSVRRWLEAAVLAAGALAVAVAIAQGSLLLFSGFPFLVWAAVRFHHRGATPCALVISTGAILAAARGVGPFEGLDIVRTMVTLQAFNGTVAVTGLSLATVTAERDQAHRAITHAVAQVSAALAEHPALPLDTSLWASLRRAAVGGTDRGTAPGGGTGRGTTAGRGGSVRQPGALSGGDRCGGVCRPLPDPAYQLDREHHRCHRGADQERQLHPHQNAARQQRDQQQ